MIFKDLFTNLSILISILSIYSQFTKNRPLNRKSSMLSKVLIGTLGGLLGNILMYYSIQIQDTLIDLRHIPIILLAFNAGALPAFLSMTLIILGRFLIGINMSSILAVPLMLLTTIGAVYISRTNLPKNGNIFIIFTWHNIVFSVFASYLIKDIEIFILIAYWIVSYIGGYIAFYILEYIRSSQLLFERYKSESLTDGLTGLNNYRKFDDIFNKIIKKVDEKNEHLSLLFIDIDFFKKVNDKYGHTQGDEVLKQLGGILQSCTRSFDIVSRNGGEEFTVLLLDSPLKKAIEVAEDIRETVREYPFHIEGKKINITLSIGVSSYQETTFDVAQIIDDADKALYTAKQTGRNKVCVANYSKRL